MIANTVNVGHGKLVAYHASVLPPCIGYKRVNLEELCDISFTKEGDTRAHDGIIHLILDENMWPSLEPHYDPDPIEPPPRVAMGRVRVRS